MIAALVLLIPFLSQPVLKMALALRPLLGAKTWEPTAFASLIGGLLGTLALLSAHHDHGHGEPVGHPAGGR